MRDVVPLYEHPYLDSSVNVETCFLFINDAYCIIYFEWSQGDGAASELLFCDVDHR